MARTLIQNEPGPIDALTLTEVPEPHAGPGQVRVKVHAAGINPFDWKIATGLIPAAAHRVSFPLPFGRDFAGEIDEVGEGIEGLAVGDRVVGSALGYGIGDFVAGEPFALHLTGIPEGVSFETAAALPVVANTSVAIVDDLGDIDGKTVLIGGGNGGVGSLAIQYALSKGARVLATGSPAKADSLRALGAQPVAYGEGLVDRLRDAAPNGIDAVADAHGLDAVNAGLALGVDPARITSVAGPAAPKEITPSGAAKARKDALEDVLTRVARGEFRVTITATYPLEDYAKAVEYSQSGKGGRVVITV